MTGPQFAYRAADRGGSIAHGLIQANRPEEAKQVLESRGLYLLELREAPANTRRGQLPLREFANVLRGLSALVEAGLPLDRAMETSIAGVSARMGLVLSGTVSAVRAGHPLSSAWVSAGFSVPAVTIGMIRAGEASGRLAPALGRAADHLDHDLDIRGRALQAIAYPALLMVTGGVALVLMVSVVIPRFAALLADWGQAMPPLTRAVLTAASITRTMLPVVLIGGLVGVAAVRVGARSPDGRRRLARWFLGLPLAGPIRHHLAGSRLAYALGAQVGAGIPLVTAMASAGGAVADAELSARMTSARERVIRGEPFDQALVAERVFPPTADGLLAAGFHSARLEPFLDLVGRRLAAQADARIKAFLTLLEPGLIVLFGGVIAIVAAALLQAMYALRPAAP